jgi:hypothetical protein
MKPIKSSVTFFRKQLGFKGKSEHNGRGVYEMFFSDEDLETNDIILRLRTLIDKWHAKDIIDVVTEDEKFLTVSIKTECFAIPEYLKDPDMSSISLLWKESYRTLCVNKQCGAVGVLFSC